MNSNKVFKRKTFTVKELNNKKYKYSEEIDLDHKIKDRLKFKRLTSFNPKEINIG